MRLLVLTHRLPFAPNRGDRIRAFHLLRVLAARHEVHLVSLLHDEEERRHLFTMSRMVASASGAPVSRLWNFLRAGAALAGSRPLTHVLLASRQLKPALQRTSETVRPDVVIAYGTGMVPHAFEPPLNRIPCVLDMVDVDSEKWAALAANANGPLRSIYAREARALRSFERSAVRRVFATTVVSERERDLAQRVLDGAVPLVIPNGVDVASFAVQVEPAASFDVVFCGVFNYFPNEQAAVWLATNVWPAVKAAEPRAMLRLVGMHPSRAVRSLAQPSSVDVTGAVEDVRPYLWRAAAAVTPLQISRGVQNKVLEAIAAGLPCVITPQVSDGLPETARSACVVAADSQSCAEALLTLLRMAPAKRRALAARADLSALTWSKQLEPFVGLVEEAGRHRNR